MEDGVRVRAATCSLIHAAYQTGTPGTSGAGPSSIAFDFPFSSTQTILRTGFFELRAHHDEGHEASAPRIGPAVPVAELHYDIARLHDALAVVQEQHALAFEKDAVIDGRRLVDGRAVGVLSTAVPGSARPSPRR